MVHLGRFGGLRSTRSGGTGNIGTRREFTSLSNFHNVSGLRLRNMAMSTKATGV